MRDNYEREREREEREIRRGWLWVRERKCGA
jgi:hypothetical protein